MDEFTYNDELHEYRLSGELIPCVSDILFPLNDFSAIPFAVLEKAREYGKAVHTTIALGLAGEIENYEIDEILLQVWQEFEGIFTACASMQVETPLYCKKPLFAGTPDIVTPDAIYDIKTRAYCKKYDLQLAAYNILAGGNRDLFVIELIPNKKARIVSAKNRQAKSMFLYMLDYYYKTREFNEKINHWR